MIASRFDGRGVLLAIATLGAVPAAARLAPTRSARTVVVVVPAPMVVRVAEVVEVKPLVMRTGAPACANVFSKAGARSGTRCAR